MIEHAYRELYSQSSVEKQMIISYDGGQITNEDLYSESFELTESLCSESTLRFGSCEASVVEFEIANTTESLIGKWLEVSQVLGENQKSFSFGKYKVQSDVPNGNRNYRNITAYDAMYDIINMDVVSWYDSLTFPMSLKAFRDSFFKHVGIEQVNITLIQDSMIVDKTIEADELSGLTVLSAICEINGVFGHINRQGKFVYVSLLGEQNVQEYDTYVSCEYEDFETEYISSLQIRQEADDIGVIVGDGNNRYVVEDNFLAYGKEIDDLTEIAEALYEKVREVQYRPFKGVAQGNPCIEVGDTIVFYTRNMDVESYVFERTLKGIQSLRDTFEAKGTIEYEEEVNSTHRDVVKLKGKTNVIERNVEETKSTIKNVENDLKSQISQTADTIALLIKQGKLSEEQLAKISLEVSRALNSDGISKNSAIEYYETEEPPTLNNYPTTHEFFIWDKCSDTLYCSDDLICGTQDYDSHIGEIAKNGVSNLYYIFELADGEYVWRQLTEAEVEEISERNASVKVTEYGVIISSKHNEEYAQLEVTPSGAKATVLFCC